MFRDMENSRTNIIDKIISLVYFMRGSISYPEMMTLSYYERQAISLFLERRLEQEENKTNPVY
jgi:hypothetical protein